MRSTWRVMGLVLAAGGAWAGGDAPAAAQVARTPEPALAEDLDAWQDAWWVDGTRSLPAVPAQVQQRLAETRQRVTAQHKDGLYVGSTQVVVGVEEANTTLRTRLGTAKERAQATVTQVGPHVTQAADAWRGHSVQAWEDAAQQHALSGAAWEAAGTRSAAAMDETGAALRQRNSWAQHTTAAAWETAQRMVPTNTGARVEAARVQGGQQLRAQAQAAGQDLTRVNRQQDAHVDSWAVWTARQPGDGMDHTRAVVGDDLVAAVDDTAQAAVNAEVALVRSQRQGEHGVGLVAQEGAQRGRAYGQDLWERGQNQQQWFAQRQQGLEEATVDRMPDVANRHVDSTVRDARGLWRLGYQQYLQGGTQEAGDNLFAGDVEGVALGSFYLVASGVQGGGVLLVLEPLAAASNVTAGSTHVGALGAAGVVGTGALQGTRLVVTVGSASLGAATLVAMHTYLQARVAAAVLAAWLDLGWTATAGAARTGWAAGRGLVRAGWDGVAGTAATATRTGAGAVVTLASATAGRALTHAAWLGRASWGVGVASGAGALAMAWPLLVHAAAVGGGTMLGGAAEMWTAAWVAGAHVVLPVRAAAVVVGTHAAAGAQGLVRHTVVVPFTVARHGVFAAAQSAWALLEDPLAAGVNLAQGVGGHAGRMGAHGVATAVTWTTGTAWAGAQGAGSVVHHTGRMVLAGGAKVVDHAIAPFRFDKHARYVSARRPQLEGMLAAQDDDVKARVGTTIRYVRVHVAGEQRGTVEYFTVPTSSGGQRRFTRRVDAQCAVLFVGEDGTTVDSGWEDQRCAKERG